MGRYALIAAWCAVLAVVVTRAQQVTVPVAIVVGVKPAVAMDWTSLTNTADCFRLDVFRLLLAKGHFPQNATVENIAVLSVTALATTAEFTITFDLAVDINEVMLALTVEEDFPFFSTCQTIGMNDLTIDFPNTPVLSPPVLPLRIVFNQQYTQQTYFSISDEYLSSPMTLTLKVEGPWFSVLGDQGEVAAEKFAQHLITGILAQLTAPRVDHSTIIFTAFRFDSQGGTGAVMTLALAMPNARARVLRDALAIGEPLNFLSHWGLVAVHPASKGEEFLLVEAYEVPSSAVTLGHQFNYSNVQVGLTATAPPSPAPTSVGGDDEEEGTNTLVIVVVVVVVCVMILVVVGVGVVFVVRKRASARVSPQQPTENADAVDRRRQSHRPPMSQADNAVPREDNGSRAEPATSSAHSTMVTMRSQSSALTLGAPQRTASNFRYQRGRLLGRGATGTVYSALLDDGSMVAVKEIPLRGENSTAVDEIQCEMDIMAQVRSPFIVKYLRVDTIPDTMQVCLFTELITGGSLGQLVRGLNEPLSETTAQRFSAQIVLGLTHIHELGIVHRDLKGDNILLAANGCVKLCDFGSARKLTLDMTHGAQTVTGTPYFMAPEVTSNGDKGYDTKADIWSLGVTVVEILSQGKTPWPKFTSAWQALTYIATEGNDMVFADHVSPLARDFVTTCCQRDPSKRASSIDLLKHPWLADAVPGVKRLLGRAGVEVDIGRNKDSSPTGSTSTGTASPTAPPDAPPALRRKSTAVRLEPLSAGSPAQLAEIVKDAKPTYRLGRILGKGAFGTIYLALLDEYGEQVAAKKLSFNMADENIEKRLASLQQEVKVMKTLSHPHLVQYLFTDRPPVEEGQDPCLLLFMEYVSGGTLADIIEMYGALSEKTTATFAAQLLLGIDFLHFNRIVHRDIKPANVLVTTIGTLKLTDFGTAKELRPEDIMNSAVNLSMQGTPAYMAPELVRGSGGVGPRSDIWSFGCAVLEMLTGEPPWTHLGGRKNPMKVMTLIGSDTPMSLPRMLSPLAADFLSQCLDKNPKQRSDAAALLRHKWIRQFDIIEHKAVEAEGGDLVADVSWQNNVRLNVQVSAGFEATTPMPESSKRHLPLQCDDSP